MDNNAILKLSNKKLQPSKKKFTTNVRIEQTNLVDSVTNRMMNAEQIEEQPSNLIQQSLGKSKSISPSDESFDNDVNQSELKDKVPDESPLSQSKIDEMIYGSNYGNPAVQNEVDFDQAVADLNLVDNVGFAAMDINCPYCNTHVQSSVNSNCNCFTCFIFMIMIIIFPLICVLSIYKAGRGSSRCCFCYSSDDDDTCTCCNDVRHVCPKCGKIIGESDSCSRLFSCAD